MKYFMHSKCDSQKGRTSVEMLNFVGGGAVGSRISNELRIFGEVRIYDSAVIILPN